MYTFFYIFILGKCINNPATAKAGAAPQNLKKISGAEMKRVAILYYNSHRVAIFTSLEG